MKLTCIRILYLQYAPHLSINVCTLIHVLKFHSMDTCPSKRCHWWLLFNHNWDDWLRWQAHFWDDSRPPIRHYWCSSPKNLPELDHNYWWPIATDFFHNLQELCPWCSPPIIDVFPIATATIWWAVHSRAWSARCSANFRATWPVHGSRRCKRTRQ